MKFKHKHAVNELKAKQKIFKSFAYLTNLKQAYGVRCIRMDKIKFKLDKEFHVFKFQTSTFCATVKQRELNIYAPEISTRLSK